MKQNRFRNHIRIGLSFILLLSFWTCGSDVFKWVIFSNDSLLSIYSEGNVSQGSTHASSKISLRYFMDGFDTTITTFVKSGKKSQFPIFTEVVCAPCQESIQTALIIGWDSYGSGTKSYTGWFINYNLDLVSVADWFQISMPRNYPTILYDTITNRIAVVSPQQVLNSNPNAYTIKTGTGIKIDVKNRKDSLLKSFEGWIPYQNHPYATKSSNIKIDSLFAVAIISIKSNSFQIDTTKGTD